MFKPSLLLVTAAMFIGCSQNNQQPVPVTYQTPQYESRALGYIVQVDLRDVPALEKNFAGRIEVINAESGIYKVLAESENEIYVAVPAAEVHKNILLGDGVIKSPAFEALAAEIKEVSPAKELSECADGEEPATPSIKILNEKELRGKSGMFERNQTLKLAAADETPNVRRGWFLISPGETTPKGPLSQELEFDLKLETFGHYEVGILVQDEKNVCALTVLKVGVTANPKFDPKARGAHALLQEMEQKFAHLDVINAPKAWNVTQGEGQVIAILDSGVNYNHPYLNGNILVNSKEIPDNDKDDDGNGLIDDHLGWDYVQDDGLPFDDAGHGSHVAGLAAAESFGVAPKAKILPVKVIDENGAADMAKATAAIYYAIHRKVNVINASFGGPMDRGMPQQALQPISQAFAAAEKAGIIIVTAAGNGTRLPDGTPVGLNTDVVPHLPASLPFLNNIAVAAVDFQAKLTPYSNYGKKSVKVAAPGGIKGQSLFSAKQETTQGELFWGAEGTSMAAPLVSGMVALIKSANPKLTVAEINDVLVISGSESAALKGKVQSGRLLDAYSAVTNAKAKVKAKPARKLAKRG